MLRCLTKVKHFLIFLSFNSYFVVLVSVPANWFGNKRASEVPQHVLTIFLGSNTA